ncbi:MAG: response regulator [Pseudomonadota bacterium]|nr:response regulator [Pseudomonadota bacterium]
MPDAETPDVEGGAQAIRPRPSRPQSAAHGPPAARKDFPIVAIGASAGGLDACTKLLGALSAGVGPGGIGMAFILVQHLDPTRKSLLVDLLAENTALTVKQAADGMAVEREHLYIIPPGTYLSVQGGALQLSAPNAPRGARLPFDFLLQSLSKEYGPRVICVVLSGSGADGSAGLRAVKDCGGRVIVQAPEEAGFDGMPRSAIATGLADAVLAVGNIPAALAAYGHPNGRPAQDALAAAPSPAAADPLTSIIDLLLADTKHDFTSYKRGTLERRIGRRMALWSLRTDDMARYLDKLRGDPAELALLGRDLLIHVTGFFRDKQVYATLAETVIPSLLDREPQGRAGGAATGPPPLRVWVAGCSTGEEAYSLVILFREAAAAAGREIKLQVFASDIDAEAVATAREGRYSDAIASSVSASRLARFFSKEDGGGYRVLPELRAAVVFTVQDLLTDPPFSGLDLLSCRNLMIYLGPEAQARAVALFHFALKQGGVLLLGSAESVGEADGRFEVLAKAERLYRHIGRRRPGDLSFAVSGEDEQYSARAGRAQPPSRQAALAALCRQQVLDLHAPAAVLCNARHECLYSLGPTDLYLRMAPGHVTPDVVAMARSAVRTQLRSALGRAAQEGVRVVVAGGTVVRNGHLVPFSIDVQPVQSEGETLLLVCFLDGLRDGPVAALLPSGGTQPRRRPSATDGLRIAELERELEAARAELNDGARNLEALSEEQRAINEEALSVNEEYQSTNEELLTSKEELQSLNEELQALNSQLQETLERQRTTSNDLQNILYSTDVATLFLDRDMNIRFFTPATRALFNVIPGDVGRPLSDLHSLATDTLLPTDAEAVLRNLRPVEREVETPDGTWFRRRVLPYFTEGQGVEGVVITFNDITRRKQAAAAVEIAKQSAEAANLAKSRFLAAASHDLRQPLQTLTLLQGLLAANVEGGTAAELVVRLDKTLGAMTGMLDTLLDLNQIEAGIVHTEVSECRVGPLLDRMRDEFAYHARAKGLVLRVVASTATVRTDPQLLEQMLRNLLSNAIKYTDRGRVLLGCRRHAGGISIQVWDTGIGIADGELEAVFEEYHQIGNEARERSRGLGLGLSIVQRLAVLLGHRVRARSRPGEGSMFSIEVASVPGQPPPVFPKSNGRVEPLEAARRRHRILVVEDDPDLRSVLELLLSAEGHHVTAVTDGAAALDLVAQGALRPDLLLADNNLPGGMSGLQVAALLRERIPGLPVLVLTGDIRRTTLRDIARQGCTHLSKPVKPNDLLQAIQDIRPSRPAPHPAGTAKGAPVIFVVDDDTDIREALRGVLEAHGSVVEDYPGGEQFLAAYRPGREACLVVDAAMPGMDGLELLARLDEAGHRLPAIMITGHGDVAMAVRAMKAGALDFIEKPVRTPELLASIGRALDQSRDTGERAAWRAAAAAKIAGLSKRQLDVMSMVLAGHPSKNIAADLGISQRTVDNHRASIMRKTGAKSLPALARLAQAAAT